MLDLVLAELKNLYFIFIFIAKEAGFDFIKAHFLCYWKLFAWRRRP